MKNRNNVFTATLVVLAFAFAPVVKAAQHLRVVLQVGHQRFFDKPSG